MINTVADGNNEIPKNTAIDVPLKYLIDFWRSLKIPMITCKVELKHKMANYFVLSVAGADNDDADSDNIVFTIKDTKLFVHIVTLLAQENQKLSKLFSKGFERSVYGNEYKTKSKNKNITNEYRYFLESMFVGVNRLFVFVYSNQDVSFKRFKTRKYYLPKSIIKNYNVIINGKTFRF